MINVNHFPSGFHNFLHEKPGIRHYLILKTLPALPAQVPLQPCVVKGPQPTTMSFQGTQR
jgi:hypothetical protein